MSKNVKTGLILLLVALECMFVLVLQNIASRGTWTYRIISLSFSTLIAVSILWTSDWNISFRSRFKASTAFLGVLGAWCLSYFFHRFFSDWLIGLNPDKYALGAGTVGNGIASPSAYYSIFAAGIFAPIAEEIIFRFGLMGTLKRHLSTPPALLLSSAIFSLGHFSVIANYGTFVSIFFMGLMLGITYLSFGLGWSMLLHSMMNLMPLIIRQGTFNNTFVFCVFLFASLAGLVTFFLQSWKVFMGSNRASRKSI